MKKMGYTLIFLLVLIVVVFVGCGKFSDSLGSGKTAANGDGADSVTSAGDASDPFASAYDPAAEASEFIHEMEGLTDENGVTLYSPEDISAFADAELNTDAIQPTSPAETPSVTQAPATQAPSQPAGTNEYDVLRGGTFYAVGSMDDGSTNQPMEIAISANSIYMATKMEDVDMALLQSNGNLYMIYPAKQIYLEVNATIQKMMGFDASEMMDVSEMGFSDMPALSEATTVADGELNGTQCKIYTFDKGNNQRTVVYMNGNKLLAFENVESGVRSATYITSITASIPADKMNPPSNYKKVNLIQFMTAMSDVL